MYKLTLFVYLFFQLCIQFKFMNLFNLCTNVVVENKIVLLLLLLLLQSLFTSLSTTLNYL